MIISDKQKEFIRNAHHRYNLKVGARRCGKTYLDNLYTIPKRIIERSGKDSLNLILGVSKGTIERNVLQPLRQLYGKDFVSTINSANIATLFGEEVYCLGAEKINQVSKIQGTSVKYCLPSHIAIVGFFSACCHCILRKDICPFPLFNLNISENVLL